MASTVYLVGPWVGDPALQASLQAAVARIGARLCGIDAATGVVRVRRIGPERWIESDSGLVGALIGNGGSAVCAFELAVDPRAGRAVLHRLRPDPVHREQLARCTGVGLELPEGVDADDLADYACDMALTKLAADGGTVSPGSAGTTMVFYRAG